MIRLLDTVDQAFGWIGISYRFPSSWTWTADEVAEVIEKRAERAQATRFIIRHNRKRNK